MTGCLARDYYGQDYAMGIEEDLATLYTEYLDRLSDLSTCTTIEEVRDYAAWQHVWYITERYKIDQHPAIFPMLHKRPKDSGLAAIIAHAKEEITDVQLYVELFTQAADRYRYDLEAAGVATIPRSGVYLQMIRELALEGLKACIPNKGIQWTAPGEGCPEPVAEAGAVLWLSLVEQMHALASLPTVANIKGRLESYHNREREILEVGDFRQFALTPQERAILGLIIAGVDPPAPVFDSVTEESTATLLASTPRLT